PQNQPALIDPWIALAAIAMKTQHVTIGPMVATLARRRPWKVAREVITLDHLSGGRMVLGVGLGQSGSGDFAHFGEESDRTVRARKLDEALDIVAGLCSGEPFSYQGQHFQIQETVFLPRPVQKQIPIWVGGWWPHKAPMRRAARWDGAYPGEVIGTDTTVEIIPTSPATARTMLDYIMQHRTKTTPFDLVISRPLWHADPGEARDLVAQFGDAGVTWLMQDLFPWEVSPADARALIRRGPPGTP
ncbi:MAG TPA: LLM class flavin-dependent oxidoreductase, partial [Herpetosiphonaceae bacterium]